DGAGHGRLRGLRHTSVANRPRRQPPAAAATPDAPADAPRTRPVVPDAGIAGRHAFRTTAGGVPAESVAALCRRGACDRRIRTRPGVPDAGIAGRHAFRTTAGGVPAESVAALCRIGVFVYRIRAAHEPRRNRQLPGSDAGNGQPSVFAFRTRRFDKNQSTRSSFARRAHPEADAGPGRLLTPRADMRTRILRAVSAMAISLALMAQADAQTPLPPPYNYDEPLPAAPRPAPAPQDMRLGAGKQTYRMPVYANRKLAGPLDDVRRVVVMLPDDRGDADRHYQHIDPLLQRDAGRRADTLVLALEFPGVVDTGHAGRPAWRKAAWQNGGLSVRASGRPGPVGAFQVLDDLLGW